MEMKTIHTDVLVIGAGPAGLSAAISAAEYGAKVILVDEHDKPGGQLFKQIHKFFGSEKHHAGTRGIDIANDLVEHAKTAGVDSNVKILLNSAVYGLFQGFKAGVMVQGKYNVGIEAKRIIVCTGASENTLSFENSTLPGVVGAGAAQTLMNVYGVAPGKKVLMIGSGNVGLIVTYQLLQAGVDVVGIAEFADKVGGYAVHAAKIRRAGVPIWTNTTIVKALGEDTVNGAVVADVDEQKKIIPGTERTLDVDLVCLACGLRPMTELLWMAGCEFTFAPELGGHVPVHDRNMQTSVSGLYVAGDAAGIEEASIAMEEGKLAGMAAAANLSFIPQEKIVEKVDANWESLSNLRSGCHGAKLAAAKARICDRKGAHL